MCLRKAEPHIVYKVCYHSCYLGSGQNQRESRIQNQKPVGLETTTYETSQKTQGNNQKQHNHHSESPASVSIQRKWMLSFCKSWPTIENILNWSNVPLSHKVLLTLLQHTTNTAKIPSQADHQSVVTNRSSTSTRQHLRGLAGNWNQDYFNILF